MKFNNEIKIGLMTCLVFALLAYLTIKTGKINFNKKGYEVTVEFQTIDGIDTNAPVRLNGLEVGTVKNIEIDTMGAGKMILTLFLNENAKLREGSKAYVKMMGFMGEKYVGLTFGNPDGAFLSPGAVIQGQEPADFDKLMTDGGEIAGQIKEITTNVNAHLKKNDEAIDRILDNVDTSMKNIVSITNNLDERLALNKNHIDETIAHLNSASINLDEFTFDLKSNPWKLLYRPPLTKKVLLKDN